MIELKNDQAINYLNHLTATLKEAATTPRCSHGLLLLTLLRLEKALFQTYLEGGHGQVEITITDSGFPDLPQTLAHAGSALEIHKAQVNTKKQVAARLLNSLKNLDQPEIVSYNEFLAQHPSPYTGLAEVLSNCTQEQIIFLEKVCRHPNRSTATSSEGSYEDSISRDAAYINRHYTDPDDLEDESEVEQPQSLPIYHDPRNFPGILIMKPAITPFLESWNRSEVVNLAGKPMFYKFVDSPRYPVSQIFGTKEKPLDSTTFLDTLPRPPAIFAGMIENRRLGKKVSVHTPTVAVWLISSVTQAPSQYDLTPRRAEKTRELADVDPTIIFPLLSANFTRLPDSAINNIFTSLSKVNSCLHSIFSQTDSYSQNLPTDLSRIEKEALEANALISPNHFHAVSEEIRSGIRSRLWEEHQKIKTQKPAEARLSFNLFGRQISL